MLITSRESGRWIIPKGNIGMAGAPHLAAAQEAEEEAGIIGSACPVALGQYRYLKRRNNGRSTWVDVDVFPFAVTTELADWKEASQRQRQWFSLSEAADLVDEPDLRDLIRSFGPQDFKAAAGRFAVLGTVARRSGANTLWGWLRGFLPSAVDYQALFEAHAETLVAGADALARLMLGGSDMAAHIAEISHQEHLADDITRNVLQNVRRAAEPALGRAATTGLITAMDDSIDQMQQTAEAVSLYDVTTFDQGMQDMAAIIRDAARVTAEAIPLLRAVRRNRERLSELTERLVRMEGRADEIHTAGLKRQFLEHGQQNLTGFFVHREIYQNLERVVDRLEDVANAIDGIVIDHS